jgi:3-hydroxyisobutyryl-CoA hydrolase
VTEKAVFAMPETAIGFFPDVGGSHFLPRLPGKLGLFLALTGHRLSSRDIFKAGVATHFVPSAQLINLEQELIRLEAPDIVSIDKILTKYQEQWEEDYKKEFVLKQFIGRMNSAFGEAHSVEQIIDNLNKDNSDWAKKQIEILRKMSPTSLKVTFELLKRGHSSTLPECLKMEFRISQHFMEKDDFYSGVKASKHSFYSISNFNT